MQENILSPFNFNYQNLNTIESQPHYKKKDIYRNNNDIQILFNKENEFLLQEAQSSIDNIFGNLTNSSPNINLPDNINYIRKHNLIKTPKKYINKKLFLNNNSPFISNFNYDNSYQYKKSRFSQGYQNRSNNNLLRHTTDCNKKSKAIFKDYTSDNNIYLLRNKNKFSDYSLETKENFENENLYYSLLQDLKEIKQKNIKNKNELARFKNDFFKMEKILLKGVEEYFKTIKVNNIKQKQLEKELNEYKIKYNNLLYNNKNNNNIIKEINEEKKKFEKELNDNKNNEIKEIKNKYENKIKEQNENIEQLNFEINALKLENKNLLNQIKQQSIKNKMENINTNNIGNFKKNDLFKELEEKNNEIKALKQKNFEYLKKLENRTQKSPMKLNIQEETINKESNLKDDDNLNDNKKLKSTINILKIQNNNFMKEYFKYKEIAEKLTLEKDQVLKERDNYKKKSAELFNEIKIIKMNNDRMNNIKIRNNILINNNLLIKSKANSFSKDKENENDKDKEKEKEKSSFKNKIPFKRQGSLEVKHKRSKSVKTKLKLNKNKDNDSGNLTNRSNENDNKNNSKNKKFDDLKFSDKIVNIWIKGERMNKNIEIKNIIPNNNIKNIQQENNNNLEKDAKKNLKSDKIDNLEMSNKINEDLMREKEKNNEMEKKYNLIIEKLKSEIKKKEQCITKYELEKQIAEKNKKKISDSNSHQINGLNELIKLLKDKNQKLNFENEKLRTKTDERIIELIKELNIKDKESSSLMHKINVLKKELNKNGIDIPNIDNE